jgi:hypothetical protein
MGACVSATLYTVLVVPRAANQKTILPAARRPSVQKNIRRCFSENPGSRMEGYPGDALATMSGARATPNAFLAYDPHTGVNRVNSAILLSAYLLGATVGVDTVHVPSPDVGPCHYIMESAPPGMTAPGRGCVKTRFASRTGSITGELRPTIQAPSNLRA